MIFWYGLAIGMAIMGWPLYLVRQSRERHKASLAKAAELIQALRARVEADALVIDGFRNPLTPTKTRVQDVPKRLSGAQLRRVADQVNVAAFAGLQERPNSEILQEQENG